MSSPLQLAGEVSGIVGHGQAHMSGILEFSLRRPRDALDQFAQDKVK